MIALAGKPRVGHDERGRWTVTVQWVGHDPLTMHFFDWRVALNVALSYTGARP